MEFVTQPFQKKVDKPWGYEIIYTPEGLPYTGKILFIQAGKRLSLQYHDQKIETVSLFSGETIFWLEGAAGDLEKINMELHKGYTVAVGQKHRLQTVTDSFILESSLPETGITFRVEDDYKRPNETESIRGEENRGWKA